MDDTREEHLRNRIADLKQKIADMSTSLALAEKELETIHNTRTPENNITNGKFNHERFATCSEINFTQSAQTFERLSKEVQRLNEKLGETYVIREEDVEHEALIESPRDEYVIARFSKHITERYSRQIILDQIGVEGQAKLLNASVLVIGCGGIGSPCIQYLAACGVGTLGLVDYDLVELSNLHRQVIHSAASIGTSKVASAKAYVKSINENVVVHSHEVLLDATNACDIVRQYDVICDASDNPPTRYLVNDACLAEARPLIAASALGLEGQLCVYRKGTACYRCFYPTPPPPETVGSCGENGVLGPVPGLMGTLQAIETVKLLLGLPVLEKLLIYDAETCRFLSVKMRPRKDDCICARPSEIKLVDYEQFCSSKADDKSPNLSLLSPSDHIDVCDYRNLFLTFRITHALVDVRSQTEFELVRLRHATHLDIRDFDRYADVEVAKWPDEFRRSLNIVLSFRYIFVICRRGNNSQKVVLRLNELIQKHRINVEQISGKSNAQKHDRASEVVDDWLPLLDSYIIKNIRGGYHGWCKYIDDSLPMF